MATDNLSAWWNWEERSIVSEDAEADAWQRLSSYTYEPNIRSYWEQKGLSQPDENTVTDWVIGCFRQARAYFDSGKSSPLDIRPLLLYYGTTTLLSGVMALLQAQEPPVNGHGMGLKVTTIPPQLADVKVDLFPSQDGALFQFASCFSSESQLAHSGAWSLRELLGSLPDLKSDFELCYPESPTFCHLVEPSRIGRVIVERLKVQDLRKLSNNEASILPLIHRVKELYIPHWTENHLSLFPQVGKWDAAKRAGWIGLDGRKYLQIGHQKNKRLVVPHLLMFYLITLYALGFLSRYKPQIWNPFAQRDATGERLVIERFLSSSTRNIPNFALDFIHQCRFSFVSPNAESRSPQLTSSEIQAEIASQVEKQIEAWKRQGGLGNANSRR